MNPDPDFNRVRTALLLGQPDRVPLAEVGVEPNIKEAFLEKKITSLKDEVEFWVMAGYDYVLLGRNLVTSLLPGVYRGRPYKSKRDESSQQKSLINRGSGINHIERWAATGSGVISNMREFEEYPWPDPYEADYSEFEEIDKYLPKGMKVITSLAGVYQYTWMIMGFETFAFALIDNIELVKRIFNRMGEIRIAVFEQILSKCRHIGAVWLQDDLAYESGLMMRPEIYRKYVFPWYREIGDICKKRHLPLLFHSDGSFWELLDDLLDIGVNAIHPIEPKGMGANIRILKEEFGNKICLIGGVDLDILSRGTPEETTNETIKRIKEIAPRGGYILGSSNTISEFVLIDNYRTMIETTLKYGKYPI